MLTAAELFFGIPPAYYVSCYTREVARLARILTVRTKRIVVASFNREKGGITLYPVFRSSDPVATIRIEGSEAMPWRVVVTVHNRDVVIDWDELVRKTFPKLSVLIKDK